LPREEAEDVMDHPTRSPYPSYDVLDKWDSPDWDEQTREVVRRRLFDVPERLFFTEFETLTLEAVAERIVPQPDRSTAERVPIVPWIDARLHRDQRNGYRYDGMPPQREAWRAGIAGINETAAAIFGGKRFVDVDGATQDEILRRIERGDPPGSAWANLPAKRFFTSVLCTTIVKTYYAHPKAWSETGYNGPSSPRGHMRIWEDGVDPWEARETPVPRSPIDGANDRGGRRE
jgi:hypothetical protein